MPVKIELSDGWNFSWVFLSVETIWNSFLKTFLEDLSTFCGATDTSIHLCDPQIHLQYNTCMEVSMATTYLQIMYPQALVGVPTHDHVCQSTTL